MTNFAARNERIDINQDSRDAQRPSRVPYYYNSDNCKKHILYLNLIYMKTRLLFFISAMLMTLSSVWAQGPNGSGTYYKDANGKKGAALKSALATIINPHKSLGYDGLFKAYEQTDKRPDGKVRDWYSCTTNYNFSDHTSYKKEGDCYNREHSVPQSWFKGSASSSLIKCDVVHVVPTDGYVNNRRSSYPLAEVNNVTYSSNEGYSKLGSCKTAGYSNTVFEPNDEIKGDMARMYFYMVTCYESQAPGWGHSVFSTEKNGFTSWYIDMLRRWAQQDGIDEREVARNNAVYATQQNRNPFVDYPGLEEYIWGDKQDVAFSYDNYEGGGGSIIPTVSRPVFTPDAGTYYNSVEVTIACATEGATIYYTTSGADASEQSLVYNGPITITETTELKAVAVKDGQRSYQASAFYQITDEEIPGDGPDNPGDDPDDVTPTDGNIQLNDHFFGTSYAGSIKASDTDDLTGTQNGITVVYALGEGSNRYCNSSQIRLYPGNQLKFSVAQGTITGLEFEIESGSPSQNLEVGGTTLTDGKWTGSAKNVTVTLGSGKHARLTGVNVTVVGGATGIDTVNSNTLDGQRVVYNLRGQRVANPTCGMYIVDGKKVFIQ